MYRSIKKSVRAFSLMGCLMLPFIISCGGGGGGGSSSTTSSSTISGQAVNGPFATGSVVTLQQLGSDGTTTGTQTTTTVTDDLGNFSATVSWSGPTLITVVGKYFDLDTGAASQADATMALALDVTSGASQSANVSTVTTVAASRARALAGEGIGFTTALSQADEEVAGEILGVYSMPSGVTLKDLNPLNGSASSDDLTMLNARLLAFDVSLDGQNTAPTDILTTFADDMSANGKLDATGVITTLNTAIDNLDASTMNGIGTKLGNYLPSGTTVPTLPTKTDLDDADSKLIKSDNGGPPPDYNTAGDNVAPTGKVSGTIEIGSGSGVTVSAVDKNSGDTHTFSVTTDGSYGTFAVDGSGTVTYTAGSSVQADEGVVTITDQGGLTGTVTVLAVPPQATNNAPTASDASKSMFLSETLSVDLSTLSDDADSGQKEIYEVSSPVNGTVDVAGKVATFKPSAAGDGSFKFQRFDGEGGSSSLATVSVTITEDPTAPAPTASLSSTTVDMQGTVTATITGNDANTADTESSLTFEVTTDPASGSVQADANNPSRFTYTAGTTAGAVSFVVTVTDSGGLSGTVTVEVTVNEGNEAPVPSATYSSDTWLSDNAVTITVSPNDPNPTDNHTFKIGTAPARGTLTPTADQTSSDGGSVTYTYTPDGSLGEDTFTIVVTDDSSLAPSALSGELKKSFTITETQVAPKPTASPGSISLTANGTDTQTVTISHGDLNSSDTHTHAVTTEPTLGTVQNNNDGTFTYTAGSTAGSDSFVITTTDNTGLTGTVTIEATLAEALPADYTYLNTLRTSAGMIVYERDTRLETAALNHAEYNIANSTTGHGETEGNTGFTGATPADRVVFANYPSRSVGEGVSYSTATGTDEAVSRAAIDGLMAAIYHRFDLLSIVNDEIGMDASQSTSAASYVHNNGNAGLATLCDGTSYSGPNTFYVEVCSDTTFRVEASVYDEAQAAVRRQNPQFVLWPPENGTDIPPAFFEESPDPLPDYSVSGYPVSVQFNETSVTTASVSSFRLFQVSDGAEITSTRLLDSGSDPNSRFSDHEYALFPLTRLDWNTAYRAELDYSIDGVSASKSWQFTTRDLGMTVHTTVNGSADLTVTSGETFAVYVPPTTDNPTIGSISTRFSGGSTLDTEYEDNNTLKITFTGSAGDTATITHDDGTIDLTIGQ